MLSFLPTGRRPGWLTLLPQGGEVTLAHVLGKQGARPEVRLLDRFPVEKDEAHTLQRLRQSHRLKSYACTTLMPEGEYNLTTLEAPQVPLEERKEALRWAIRERVSYPVENACLGILEIPGTGLPAGRSAGVIVVSAAESAVRARLSPFLAAKVPLLAVDVPELAQRNIAALFEDENRGLALLRIDENGMMLTLSFHGELVAVRRSEMNTRQLSGADADHARERLVLEVQRSLDNFDRQYSHISISRVIVACHPPADALLEALASATYVPVKVLDLSAVMDFPTVPALQDPACQARNLLALGAALREAGAHA